MSSLPTPVPFTIEPKRPRIDLLRWRKRVLPVFALVLIVLAWHFGIQLFELKDYLFPTPTAVAQALWQGLVGGMLWPHILTTLSEIVIGYVVGCTAALLFAALVSEFELLEEAIYPLMAGFQSIPKVALAPLLMVWFGFEIESKIIMVALVCFFPTFVNAFSGLRNPNPNLVALYKAFGSTRWQLFKGIKLPAAAVSIFAGLEISVVLALIGAVVAELIASRRGLGHVIASSGANFNVAMMFACVVVLALIGMALTQIVRRARRRFVFWERNGERQASSKAAALL